MPAFFISSLETFIVDSLEDPIMVVFVSYLSCVVSFFASVTSRSKRELRRFYLWGKIQNPRERRETKRNTRARGNIPHL